MTEIVLDASVLLKWFGPKEAGSAKARALRDRYQDGELYVTVPGLLFLEVLNVAARRWSWDAGSIAELAASLEDLAFDVLEPALERVASWTAEGLTAYDAVYVALAEERNVKLVTGDRAILTAAGSIARAL